MPTTPDTDVSIDADLGPVEDAVARAVAAFRRGDPVLVHDAADREGETDIIYPAGAVTPSAVAHLRNDAGGLVCAALSDGVADALDLPFLDSSIDHPTAANHDLSYDSRSSFSLPVNHRDTFTGITDADRSLTITELAAVAERVDDGEAYGPDDFARDFRSPGHVNLLRGAAGLLDERRGHTELGLALARAADLPPAVVVCEMLDDETGAARSVADARSYAQRHDLVYVEGRDLVTDL
ncbi:3,4-dihydroxy-2-butanone-4-phosphate synthase [Salinigranum rubrum]|uniref:3,4-dihydroxy-2-butanone 4-phosphate synthase n=1 Tax=Salinigranum rubrum TaxID=755307 RepID=A0A2I8VEX7_9EURY|nr:3,4-dihydroxy-2-butanone-4-phosphate synthase [Salinigranum rubrum]AUV80465.1 3,4-dihydroxy-2-butanone-4-phosphate synthase [Salinigranum rubrum]